MNEHTSPVRRTARVILIALYSDMYPAMNESHSISVLGGCLEYGLGSELEALEVVDMSALDGEKSTRLLEVFQRIQPTVVGISVQYGTYSYLKMIYPKLKYLLQDRDHLVILGGATATYLPDMILREIDETAIVVQGEGDEAIVKIVRNWLNCESFSNISNVCLLEGNSLKCQKRDLVDVSKVPPPYRKHISQLASKGGQVFVEASRGCSWAACTFCLRGLTDVKGLGKEYRRFPFQRIEHDLLTLRSNNVRVITFADEDFLGGSLSEIEQFVTDLEDLSKREKLQLCFDASVTVHSVYKAGWNETELDARKALFDRLKHIGLRKVFLGIESGSPTQLKRYGKGQTPYESAMAVKVLRNLNIELEMGFIMFDPLCTLDEIEENKYFLLDNDLATIASALANELRVQVGERYITLLKMVEQRRNVELFDRSIDTNTLSYSSKYIEPDVATLISIVRNWNALLRPLDFPLKNLSRYGEDGFLRNLCSPVRILLQNMRLAYLERLIDAVNSIKSSGHVNESVQDRYNNDILKSSQKIISIFGNAPQDIVGHPIVSALVDAAKKNVNEDLPIYTKY